MKKYFLILLSIILLSFTGCTSHKLKVSEIDKWIDIGRTGTLKSYSCRDEAKINTIVNAINNSKKAPSTISKKISKDKTSMADFVLTFEHKDHYLLMYDIWIDDNSYIIEEESTGYRVIQDTDKSEFEKIINTPPNVK